MLKRLLIAVLLGLVVLAGCGDSDDGDSSGDDTSSSDGDASGSDSDSPLVQAMAAQMTGDPDFPLTDEQANCMASQVVDGIGEERLEELGVTAESVSDDDAADITELDFTAEEVGVIVDSISGCADLKAMLAEELSADGSIAAEDAECLVNELPDDFVRGALEAAFTGEDPTGDESFMNDMLDAMSACDVDLGGS